MLRWLSTYTLNTRVRGDVGTQRHWFTFMKCRRAVTVPASYTRTSIIKIWLIFGVEYLSGQYALVEKYAACAGGWSRWFEKASFTSSRDEVASWRKSLVIQAELAAAGIESNTLYTTVVNTHVLKESRTTGYMNSWHSFRRMSVYIHPNCWACWSKRHQRQLVPKVIFIL